MDNTTTPHTTTPSRLPASTPFPSSEGNTTAASTRPVDSCADAKGAASVVDGVAAKVSSVTDGLKGGVDKVGDTRDEWIESAREVIRQHPFAAVAGALVIGAALPSLRSARAD